MQVAGPTDSTAQIREHLEEVLRSRHFRSSKRCQRLLKFLVEETIEGRQDVLKERLIGAEVFNRSLDYDPAADPIVRVTAAEVRKRLAQFYQEHPERAPGVPCFRIATGGYLPEFYSATSVEPEAPVARKGTRRWLLAVALASATWLAAVCWSLSTPRSTLDQFWGPALHSGHAPIVVMERVQASRLMARLNTELDSKKRSEKTDVVMSDIAATFGQTTMLGSLCSIRDLDRVFASRGLTPELRVGAELSTSELAERPVILVGYFNNPWAKDLNTDPLPYTFLDEQAGGRFIHGIRDNLHKGRSWTITSDRGWFANSVVSYALVTRLLESRSARFVVSIAGTTHFGTEAAGDFITGDSYLSELARQAPADWESKNLQIVLETHVVNQTPTPPRIVSSHFW